MHIAAEQILAVLDGLGVSYELFHHPAAYTMEDCLHLPFAKDDVTFCKNILLCNRQQTLWFLYVTLPGKPFRTADVSKALGVSRLSFAPADALPRLLGLESGSLSPLALLLARDSGVRLVLDRDIRRGGQIAFHPCDNTATLLFRQEDFFGALLPALQSDAQQLQVPWPGT